MANDDSLPVDDSSKESSIENISKRDTLEANPLLPSAEAYVKQNEDLEVLIERIKLEIKDELRDELARLQYLLTEKEKELRIKELQLQQQAAELNSLKERLLKIEEQQTQPPLLTREQLQEIEFEGQKLSAEEAEAIQQIRTRNPSGVGGLPGSSRSPSIVINQFKYQGDRIQLDDESNLLWDNTRKAYQQVGKEGNKFTYFAVEAAYLNPNYINPNYPQFYSQSILRKQVWYAKTPPGKISDGIGEQYKGRVPLKLLEDMLNSRINPAFVNPENGSLIEGQSFKAAYKNWRYKYQIGTFYRNKDGDLYAIIEKTEEDSKGNPPTYRLDEFGEQKSLSSKEKRKWGKTGIGSL